jgi:large subunit ribosomal protein L22e
MAITGLKKKTSTQKKRPTVKYVVDCTTAVNDNVIDPAGLEKYFHDRIKVDGKTGNLGESVTINREKAKITVSTDAAHSKRYLKVSVRANSLEIACSIIGQNLFYFF